MDESLRCQALDTRAAIASGALRGSALLDQLLAVPARDRDVWLDEVLGVQPPPADIALPHGSVPYLASGVEQIVAMVRGLPLTADDEIVDLGSGLGRVVMLAHLLSGARARGIEIQDHLVRSARARSSELGLTGVSFVHANAAEIELDGSLFYMYAPFNGEMLTRVLGRLEAVARRRPIVVCTVDLELHGVSWLRPRSSSDASLTIYES